MTDDRGADDRGTGLPDTIAAAWGVRARPGKGPKPGLSLERIVAAAIRVATADGLAAVSMSRVAAELGAATMSLYRYVNAKDELVSLMVDTAYGAPPAAVTPEPGWRDALARWAWAMRASYRRHPWLVHVPLRGLPIMPNEVAWFEQGLACLRHSNLAEAEKASVIMLVSGYVRNLATTKPTSSQPSGRPASLRTSGWPPTRGCCPSSPTLSGSLRSRSSSPRASSMCTTTRTTSSSSASSASWTASAPWCTGGHDAGGGPARPAAAAAQRPVNRGGRFSVKAVTPSTKSPDPAISR